MTNHGQRNRKNPNRDKFFKVPETSEILFSTGVANWPEKNWKATPPSKGSAALKNLQRIWGQLVLRKLFKVEAAMSQSSKYFGTLRTLGKVCYGACQLKTAPTGRATGPLENYIGEKHLVRPRAGARVHIFSNTGFAKRHRPRGTFDQKKQVFLIDELLQKIGNLYRNSIEAAELYIQKKYTFLKPKLHV